MRIYQVGWEGDQECHTRQLKGGEHLFQGQEVVKRSILKQKCEMIRFSFQDDDSDRLKMRKGQWQGDQIETDTIIQA